MSTGPTRRRWARTIQPATLPALNDRPGPGARQARVTQGRQGRIEGTVGQTAIHYPPDSPLFSAGVRVLSRLIRRRQPLVQDQLAGVRDALRSRWRTMRRGLQALHRRGRRRGDAVSAQRTALYQRLLTAARATVGHAERLQSADTPGAGRATQTERRVRHGETVVSLFEPHTRLIPRHKGGADVEFGRLVVFDEVEGGLVTRFAVLEDKTAEQGQLAHHQAVVGHPPRLATGDRGLHAPENERVAREAGGRHLVIPRSGTVSAAQRARERTPAWRRRYRWRAGIEGRRSSLRRDYGLRRCPDHGEDGLLRRVGWGVLASNLRHIGLALTARAATAPARAA